jgi:hypothetical protein
MGKRSHRAVSALRQSVLHPEVLARLIGRLASIENVWHLNGSQRYWPGVETKTRRDQTRRFGATAEGIFTWRCEAVSFAANEGALGS